MGGWMKLAAAHVLEWVAYAAVFWLCVHIAEWVHEVSAHDFAVRLTLLIGACATLMVAVFVEPLMSRVKSMASRHR